MENNRRFLDFLELAPRSSKPRTRGLTTIGDEGDPIPWVRDMLDAYGEYIDYVKFTPATLIMPWRFVEERVKLYRDYQVNVTIDDPIFAIAYYQGKADRLLRTVREIGFTHAQIDTHHIKLGKDDNSKQADEDEVKFLALARELGFKMEGEVGQKWEEGDRARAGGGLLNVPAIIEDMKHLLATGCEHVYLESRVILEAIGEYGEKERGTQQIREIVEAVGLDKVFIEITGQLPFDTRMCHRFWAVRNFGPDVNMGGGGSIKEVRFIEAVRRGITFVAGPSKSSSRLWVKSLARNRGKAAQDWWKEEYPIDLSVLKRRQAE